MVRTYSIVTIYGDGSGPEVVEAAMAVLAVCQERFGFLLAEERVEAGAVCYERLGVNMTDEDLGRCAEADAVMKGPVGLPHVRAPDGTEAGLLGGTLRGGLDLYANIRPMRLRPGVVSPLSGYCPGDIDYVLVRENVEGLYASRGRGMVWEDGEVAADALLVTRSGTERIARAAFELARNRGGAPADGVRRVTCVDKSNVLRSLAFFRSVVEEVASKYPEVELEHLYVDAAAQVLVLEPGRLSVVVTENMFGDILSDLGGATVGGLGLCPSANLGDGAAVFEPIHGSVPLLAGTNTACPIGAILSAAMMLEYLGEARAARAVERAVEQALAEGAVVLGRDGRCTSGTSQAAQAVADRLTGEV